MVTALIIFIITYALLLLFPKYRAYIALASAIIFIIIGLPFNEAINAIDLNVIMMIAGTMGIVSLFIESKMPSLLADLIISKMPNVKWTIISLALFAGIISAFVDNVATVLMVAPVALTISKKLKISPVPSIIAIAISSNLQGAATLVGDTTSILLGGHAGLDFLDFFFLEGKPGMFWIVQLGALASTFVLAYVFRKYKQPIEVGERTVVKSYFPSVLLVGMVVLLIVASFLKNMPNEINGYICIGLFIIGLVWKLIKVKSIKEALQTLKDIDYFTLLLLAGLFVVIEGISKAGVIAEISKLLSSIGNGNVFLVYTIIVWASVLLSAFIDNIPYVATMLPVVGTIAMSLGINPYLLYFGLISGATLGGNLTPIGASANIAAIGILRKEGYEVSAKQFMKLGVPFTLAAVSVGYILIWFLWK
ncbi:MAG TPA: SLC13 family permease [Bacilli bacterium]|jgi:Na+/H+ antiporter NhaD/arsenite permease-like protein|nr:TRAP transporter large permease subunit [Acholeplasmataceae bacterium]HNZ77906.1 SLC13 family permease [Bacilli bacterium]HOD60951.1 SLC13 family permease [Bacilli bacterium]HOH62174.1 SLC13 family permease [Bacilli bacterium]HPM15319.1 SLC13 family permease [Bacilli bacterium]